MEHRKDLVKEKIVAGSLEMFIERGCKNVTMDAVAKHLGMSKRTIYEKFRNKAELLFECCQLLVQKDTVLVDSVLKNNSLGDFIRASEECIKENGAWFEKRCRFMSELNHYYNDIFVRHIEINNSKRREMLKNALQIFRDKGIISGDTDLGIVTFFMNSVIQQILSGSLSIQGYTKRQMIVHFMRTYFRGIATSRALEEMKQLSNTD